MIRIIERPECLACNSIESTDCFALWDDRYAFPERFQLRQCKNCGSFYPSNSVAEESLDALYRQYYPNLYLDEVGRKSCKLRLLIPDMLNIAPIAVGFKFSGLNVLDVGCGSGTSASVVSRSGGKWTGLDIDSKRVDYLNRHGLSTILGVPESICDEMSGSFDMILASQIIEHTFSPRSFLTACHKLLKSGGVVVLSTPNGNSRFRKKHAENWIHWHVPYHTVIFSLQGLICLGKACGYSLSSVKTLTPATWWVRQKNYEKPPQRQISNWVNKSTKPIQLIIGGFQSRLGDFFKGNGDMVEIILKKI